jgi:hypothetical protein
MYAARNYTCSRDHAGDALRVYMPGAFARLGPELAEAFGATDAGHGQPVEFARFRPSGVLGAGNPFARQLDPSQVQTLELPLNRRR